ncbi:MAG: hypothetical protein RLZZ399_1428 [Verrucomicrobiota bacterium]|jgi:hypothetical protein
MNILRPKVINSAIVAATRSAREYRSVNEHRNADEIMASVLALRATFRSRAVSQHTRSARRPFFDALENGPAPHQPAIGWFAELLVKAWGKIRGPLAPDQEVRPDETLPRISETKRHHYAESLDKASDYLWNHLQKHGQGGDQKQTFKQSQADPDALRKDAIRLAKLFISNRLFSSGLILANQTKQNAIERACAVWRNKIQHIDANPRLKQLWSAEILEKWDHPSGVILNTEKLELLFKEAQGGENFFSAPSQVNIQKLKELESFYEDLIGHISTEFDTLVHKVNRAQSTFAAKISLHYHTLKFDAAPGDRRLLEQYFGQIHQYACP